MGPRWLHQLCDRLAADLPIGIQESTLQFLVFQVVGEGPGANIA
jgi:hypothetical protein